MTTLAIELAASRLLGSVFGTSNLVWASIIGLILIYLTIGYFLGGWWADRSPHPGVFYRILAWGSFTTGLIPFISRPVLRAAADAFDALRIGVLFGSFTAVLILFVVPVILLGTISPFAIRLALRDSRQAGVVSGRIYAISTLGSFVGTFLPVLLFIPLVGTTNTFLIFSVYLLVIALIGLMRSVNRVEAIKMVWMLFVLVLLGIWWKSKPIKTTEGQIFETESAYNYIQVLELGDYRYLRLNEGQGVHSVFHPDVLIFNGPWMQVLSAPFFNQAPFAPENVHRIAVVGLAAGTIARQATEVFGPIPIDGFEIDPEIIEVGRAYFGMTMENLNAIAIDGRLGLEQSDQKYTIISVDAYRPPYIPWHLTTREFFLVVYEHLDVNGSLVINVGRAPEDRSLVDGLVKTISTIFPSVYVMDVPDTFNSIIYATVQRTHVENIYYNYDFLVGREDIHPILEQAIARTITNLQPLPTTGTIFTDDLAPIEWLTNTMVLRYVIHGGVEDLQ
jgi:spermidine synthase